MSETNEPSAMAQAREPVLCDYCERPAALVGGDVIYPHRPDLHEKKFWSCPDCAAYVGCHDPNPDLGYDGTQPLGRLANAELRRAKNRAHAAFDPIWRSGRLRRRQAYAWLATQLGLEPGDCHIGDFDVAMCNRVVQVCRLDPRAGNAVAPAPRRMAPGRLASDARERT